MIRSIAFHGRGLGLLRIDEDMGRFRIFFITPKVPPSAFKFS